MPFLQFDIQSCVLHELLCIVSRPSSTSAKICLPSFSSLMGMGKPSPGMTAVLQPHVDVQRLEQDLCRDQLCSRASGHPTILMAAAVPGAALASVPVPLERSRRQKTSFLTAVRLCPALGAHSPPWPAEREQEVKEKKRRGRVRGCQPSSHLPFASALHCPCGGEAKGSRALAGLSRSPGACWPGRGRQRKFRSFFSTPPASAPWSSMASAEQT